MDMAEQLDEITYRLLATSTSRGEALRRLAVVTHWAKQQTDRLAGGHPLRVDHDQVVAEALASPVGASAA